MTLNIALVLETIIKFKAKKSLLNSWCFDSHSFSAFKGQLISECLFDVLNFPKNQRKIWQISALESKKWSNHKIKAHYNDFDTNYVQIILNIIRGCLYYVDLITFYILGQEFVKFFVVFLENLWHPKGILKLTDL